MKVLVTGGRFFKDCVALEDKLNDLHKRFCITQIIHGGCSGADALAAKWAEKNAITAITVKADWARYGSYAGPKRNTEMVAMKPHLVVVFKGGRGTADCFRKAVAAGLRVDVVN